jgi:type II secretory pathway pseudopilin PulG
MRPSAAFPARRALSRARRAGLTLIEGIGMTILVGVMAALAFPAIGGLREAGLDQQAVAVAQALNQAQQTYQLRVANAATAWSGAASGDAKYALLSPYIPYAADTLEDYAPSGYSYQFGSTLDDKVQLTGPDGAVSY